MRRIAGGLVVMLLFAGAARPDAAAAGQSTAELVRRVDEAMALHDKAAAALEAHRALAHPGRVYPDTLTMAGGAVRVVAEHEFAPIARAAAPAADAFIRDRAGAQVSQLAGNTFALWTDSLRKAEGGLVVSPSASTDGNGERYVLANATSLAEALEGQMQWTLARRNKPVVSEWLSSELPVRGVDDGDWRAVRMELISSRARIGPQCYAGNLQACKEFLGLSTNADVVTAWYDTAARRALVDERRKSGRLDPAMTSRCLAGHDADCVEMLRNNSVLLQWQSPPGSRHARMSFVQQAFAMNATGGIARFMASPDSVPAALAAIASVPLDSIVAQWQRHAHDGGVRSEIATPVIFATALGWMMAFGALSTRSSRWR